MADTDIQTETEVTDAETSGEGREAGTQAETAEEVTTDQPAPDDWRAAITDEAGRKAAERVQDVNGLAQRVVGLEKSLSKAVVIPSKDATDEEKASFRKSIGVPEKIEEYTVPEAHQEFFSSDEGKERLEAFAKTAHGLDIPNAAFQGVLEWYAGEVEKTQRELQEADKVFADQSMEELKKDWPEFDREKAFADAGAKWVFGEELEDFISLKTPDNKFIADHAIVMRALNKIGRAVSEDGTIGAFPVDAETASSLKQKLDDLTEQQMTAQSRGEMDKARRLDDEIMQISAQIAGDGPIVGSAGRSA